MNLRTLPPSMLLALGLACGEEPGDSNSDGPADSGETGSISATSTSGPTTSGPGSATEIGTVACLDVGPCLLDLGWPPLSTGPCLEPPDDSGTNTGTTGGTTGDTTGGTTDGSGTDTGTDSGMMAAEASSRSEAVERVLDRGTLPADVAARLRRTLDP